MKRVIRLNRIDSLGEVVDDFSELLNRSDNADIAVEFPNTVARYTDTKDKVIESLTTDKRQCLNGKTEKFIVFAGRRAVGFSIVTNEIITPSGVDPTWPNLSGFICNPFRNQGLGRLSLEVRIDTVREHFNNNAWTLVRNDNSVSQHLMKSVGFIKVKEYTDNNSYDLFILG